MSSTPVSGTCAKVAGTASVVIAGGGAAGELVVLAPQALATTIAVTQVIANRSAPGRLGVTLP
jgi:hypothetical protein